MPLASLFHRPGEIQIAKRTQFALKSRGFCLLGCAISGLLGAALLTGCGSAPSPESKKADASPAAPAVFKVDPATAGTIYGKVSFTGKKPAPKRIVMDEEAACVRMHKGGLFEEEVALNKDGTLANVFIYIQAGLDGKTFEPAATPVTIDQKGCRFEPHVLGIRTGQTLKVTNSDPVSHNIHPVPKMNREWNQGQAPEAAPLEREFARPEIMVPVKCNVHSWMRSYIGVVDHPYFAVSGADGSFELKDVPPGEYTVEAWQEKFGTQQQKVTVAPSGKTQAEFAFKGE
jgi:plastocyanin